MAATEQLVDCRQRGRIHSLDAYRGVLMLLGIVIHSSFKFRGGEDDLITTAINHFALISVHVFRMPAFFMLSGFFTALLWKRYGAGGMLLNRFERLVLPLMVIMFGAPILLGYPALVIELYFNGEPNPLRRAETMIAADVPLNDFLHLWFLYALIWITCITTWFIHWRRKRGRDGSKWRPWIRETFESPWRFVFILGGLNMLVAIPAGSTSVPVGTGWFLNPAVLVYYTPFFGLGWLLFTSNTNLATSADRAWTLVAIGTICVVIQVAINITFEDTKSSADEDSIASAVIFVIILATWSIALFALTRGLMGLFFRYAASESFAWRYISDASYWVYLVHLIGTECVPMFIKVFKLPDILSFLALMTITTLVSFVTYDLFVRSTFLGRFLNGRRYKRLGWRLNGPGLVLIGSLFVVYGANVWDQNIDQQKELQSKNP